MPNWTRTTYVFYADQQEFLKDFHNKLSIWIKEPSLCPDAWGGSSAWLGNILAHAGFALEEIEDVLRYRGTLEEIGDVEQGKVNSTDLNEYYYFTALTDTAWIEMPKMWQFILEKLYGCLPAKERIDFAFLSEEQNHYYVHAYNTAFLPLIGVADDEKYSCLTFIGEDFSKELAYEANQYEMTASSVAVILSDILGRDITENEVEDKDLLEKLSEESNHKLKAVNRQYYVDVVPITVVGEEDFK